MRFCGLHERSLGVVVVVQLALPEVQELTTFHHGLPAAILTVPSWTSKFEVKGSGNQPEPKKDQWRWLSGRARNWTASRPPLSRAMQALREGHLGQPLELISTLPVHRSARKLELTTLSTMTSKTTLTL